MVDIAFSDGAAGTLKYSAKQSNIKLNVLPLSLMLDIGDINNTPKNISSRKDVLNKLFDGFGDVGDELYLESVATLNALNNALISNEPVRAWIMDGCASEICGLMFTCAILADSAVSLSLIRIPQLIEQDGRILRCRTTGYLPDAVIDHFFALEKPLSKLEISEYAHEWETLANESAPLRVNINGRILSVSADFFDFALRRTMPDGDFPAALALGRALNTVPDICDRYLFERLGEMIKSGELIEVTAPDKEHPYSAILRQNL